jgi:hypothetical protein
MQPRVILDKSQRPFVQIDAELISLLTNLEFKIYAQIKSKVWMNGKCWDSLDHMARETGNCKTSLKTALKGLVQKGVITKRERYGQTAIYELTPPDEWTYHKSMGSPSQDLPQHTQPEFTPEPSQNLPRGSQILPPPSQNSPRTQPNFAPTIYKDLEIDPHIDPRAREILNPEEESISRGADAQSRSNGVSPSGRKEYNSTQRFDSMFKQRASGDFLLPWQRTDVPLDFDPSFLNYIADTYLPTLSCYKNSNQKPSIADAQGWLLKARHNEERLEMAHVYWQHFQQVKFTPENVNAAIAQEMDRLKINALLPMEWAEKFEAMIVSDLNLEQKTEYLAYLQSQGETVHVA